ncbi:hypothetical protein CC78DRAFT_544408 [Lojkania enalia]|uniref:PCI domain-containing protein n=1 Tax=Lojkania enalia TaxID=147567 RepID=A0A9P4N3X0_9PLEO|nr:hypothetical protein CC78DRAFT_544408 [Didymosphaeria enalia]
MSPRPPAYNAVPTRTTLARPTPLPHAAVSPSAAKQKVDWPQPVRDYVGRAFDPKNAIEGISVTDMQAKLKDVLQYFAERSMLEQLAWETYPLPQHLLQAERRAMSTRPLIATGPDFAGHAQLPHAYSAGAFTNNSSSSAQSAKKRKSTDTVEDVQPTPAEQTIQPSRKTNGASIQDRITYVSGHNDKRHKKNASTSKSNQLDLEKEKRRQRFQTDKIMPSGSSSRNDSDSEMMPVGPVVGTNTDLEKSYFRLTAPPKPETVRPLYILEKTLGFLKDKWRKENNYNYICNQFKSLRQDLTVQHIKNAFTVRVYELHARIALEKGDLGEYNQCQTQLRALYMLKLSGGHPEEFLAYRILYFVYTCNKTDMNDLLAELTPADKAQPAVRHALDVRSALALGNYHKFFRLYLAAPNMGMYLMDMFIERERLHALANISKAYMSVTLRFLTDELGFDSDGDCVDFLASHGAQDLIEEKVNDRDEPQHRVRVKQGVGLFESLRATAFSKVDIKGQI